MRAGEGWRQLPREARATSSSAPTQGAGCFGAAYEFLFNTSYQLKKAGLKDRVKLTYVSAEPFLGHFGIGGLPHGEKLLGMFLKKEGIDAVLDTAMDHVDDGRARARRRAPTLDFGYAMIIPPFLGQEVIARTPKIADDNGLREGARHLPERRLRRRVRRRGGRRGRRAVADPDAGGHPEDRLPDRAAGPRRREQHRRPDQGRRTRPRTRRSATSRRSA